MKVNVVVCLLALLSLFGAAAYAQDVPKFDVFAGYTCGPIPIPQASAASA
jgi:hypothetical protein